MKKPLFSGGLLPGAEATVAIKVKPEALKQPPDVAQAVTATLEYLEFVVQPFNKRTGLAVDKVVGNAVKIAVECGKKSVEAAE